MPAFYWVLRASCGVVLPAELFPIFVRRSGGYCGNYRIFCWVRVGQAREKAATGEGDCALAAEAFFALADRRHAEAPMNIDLFDFESGSTCACCRDEVATLRCDDVGPVCDDCFCELLQATRLLSSLEREVARP